MVRQRNPDSTFDIHVDPSCLGTPMDEDVAPSREDTPKAVQVDVKPESVEPVPESEETTTTTTVEGGKEEQRETTEISVEQLLQDTVDELQSQQEDAAVAPLKLSSPEPEQSTEEDTKEDSLLTTETADDEAEAEPRRSSTPHRRISGRTDALIQAAARAVVDQIERHRQEDAEPYLRDSVMSSAINDRAYTDATDMSYITETDHQDDSRRESFISESQASVDQRRESLVSESQASVSQRRESDTPSQVSAGQRRQSDTPSHARTDSDDHDRGGDSSSHHDGDSEVFSDRSHSARSSLGSFEDHRSLRGDDLKSRPNQKLEEDAMSQRTRSPRISDFSQYEREEFVPTIRGNPRPPFRTPSDVRALQMSSPPPSVFGGSPRSSKRHHLPTISRLGSPSPSAQYSPKGRTTPSRLKPRKATPPLVLLHATILPLRWPWGDVLEDAQTDSLTPEAKTLRETWRFLHDRLGDTVCERGILLPHPQNDYEILEERLLDALELPLRRRARILECGHYVGPANELTLTEDLDSDAEDAEFHSRPFSRQSSSFMSPARSSVSTAGQQTHWCGTCHHDIRFESLGPGKVFRVKVYASNGLMKAGAWAACWKEMERVDVEIEPIINGSDLQDELEGLATRQQEAADRAAEEEEAAQAAAELDESMIEEETYIGDHQLPPSSPLAVEDGPSSPSPGSSISRHDQVEERRIRDEARMREIYGEEPMPEESSPQPQDSVPMPSAESYTGQHTSPVSPSEEARARRDARRSSRTNNSLQNASLPELLLEAVRVMLQDRKNVLLVLLSCLVLFLAVKPTQRDDGQLREWDQAYMHHDVEAVIPTVPAVYVDVKPERADFINDVQPLSSKPVAPESVPVQNPCETPSSAALQAVPIAPKEGAQEKPEDQEAAPLIIQETVTSREVVRIVETITETETIKAYVTETAVKVEDVLHADAQSDVPDPEISPELHAEKASIPVPDTPAQEETEPLEPEHTPVMEREL